MSAFLIVDTKIRDAEAYEDYKKQAKPIAEKFGGIYRARGGELAIYETGLWKPTQIVIIEVLDMERARVFADSHEYALVKKLRNANANCTLFIVDGG